MKMISAPLDIVSFLKSRDVTLVDIGSRGGIDEDLMAISAGVNVVGFEPEPSEAARLEATGDSRWANYKILPAAIAGQTGIATLHIPPAKIGASLLRHNPAMLDAFGHKALHSVDQTVEIGVTTLDALLANGQLLRADYIKLDVEGAELDVIRGAESLLATTSAIKVEVSFLEQRVGQPLIWDVVSSLLSREFDVIDLTDLYRWRRRPLPTHPYQARFKMPYSKGRVSQCDLVLLRRAETCLNVEYRLVLCIIAAALGYFDHAVSVLRCHEDIESLWRKLASTSLEKHLMHMSAKNGRRHAFHECKNHLRSFIPRVRSFAGKLPFAELEIPY